MKRFLPLALLTLSLAAGNLRADTLVVLPGSSIQAKIDEAKDGDIIAIFGGSYAENLTVTKAIRFAEVQNQDVTFLGNITIEGVENPPPLQGFTFAGGKTLCFKDTTGSIIIRDCEFTAGGRLDLDPLSGTILMEGGTYNATVNIGALADKATLNNVTIKNNSLTIGEWSQGRPSDDVDDLIAEVRNCQLWMLRHVRGSAYVVDSSIDRQKNDQIAIEGAWREAIKLVIFRVTVVGRSYTRANNAWIGYSKFGGLFRFEGDNEKDNPEVDSYVFIGNEINNQNNTEDSALYVNGHTSSALIANNKIWNQYGAGNDSRLWDNCISIWNPRHPIIIQNNFLSMTREDRDPYAIRIYGDRPLDRWAWDKVKVFNNVIYNWHCRLIDAPFGTTFEGNFSFVYKDRVDWDEGGAFGGIIIDKSKNYVENRNTNPGFPGWAGEPQFEAPRDADVYTLTEDSILRNAGSANPLYNDRDGTRNDAGPSGGVWYDPEGWTTDKPVVISFDISPELVLEGVDTEVIISGGTAVSAP